jgi:uncharacterized protein (DUF488 family)
MNTALYTIGHSNVPLAVFLSALADNRVTQLVDVRSKPRSRFAQFNGRALASSLDEHGIAYTFMGDQLGGMPRDPGVAAMWKQGGINAMVIAHLRTTDHWRAGIVALCREITNDARPLAIMCSEGDPMKCHRSAIAQDAVAALPSLRVVHIAVGRYGSPPNVKRTRIELP